MSSASSETSSPEGTSPEVLDGAETESLKGAASLTALKNKSQVDAAEIAVLSNFISDVVRQAGGTATHAGAVLEVDLGVDLEPEAEAPAPSAPAPEASNADVASTRSEDAPAEGAPAEEASAEGAAEADETSQEDGLLAPAVAKIVPGSAEDLARRLRRSTLSLVFRSEDLAPGYDLVADGSPLIRKLEDFLASQGARTYVVAPGSKRLSLKALDLAAEVALAEGHPGLDRASLGLMPGKGERVKLEERSDAPGHDLFVLYRVRIRALQREDLTVCVRVALRPGVAPDDPVHVTSEVAEPPSEVRGWDLKTRRRLPPELREQGLEAADAQLALRCRELATATQTKLRETARDDLKRLHAYYAGQIAEYMRRKASDLNLIRIEELEAERELRITELIRSAEVRVSGEALSCLIVERPLQRARAVRRPKDDDETELASRWLLFDRGTGGVEWEGELPAEDPGAVEPAVEPAAESPASEGEGASA
jgi:hypothetical protein